MSCVARVASLDFDLIISESFVILFMWATQATLWTLITKILYGFLA